VDLTALSLEDLAVCFIRQTIETFKSKPAPTPTTQPLSTISTPTFNQPVSTATQSNNTNTKLELAAKQKRLEQHITESKKLMTQLAQARSKEEKDAILKAMREMTRCVPLSPTPICQYHFGCRFWLPNGLNEIFLGIFFLAFFGSFLFLLDHLKKEVSQRRRRQQPQQR
jgi:hypothetical protein